MKAPDDAMHGESADKPPKVPRKTAAEAAVWVARLHGPNRSRKMELACLAWQQESAMNRYAFERTTEVWMEVPNLGREGLDESLIGSDLPEPGRRVGTKGLVLAGICAVLGAAVALALQHWRGADDYRTEVGEAQTVVLGDGSRMSLNTDTRVRVEFGATQRTVNVDAGEAAFEVTKDAKRPFVVRVAASEVVAVGTTFSVRLTPSEAGTAEALSVILMEGQVTLRPVAGVDAKEVAPVQPVLMRPGERVRLVKISEKKGGGADQQLDRPPLDEVLAWKRNEAVFDKALLADAVAEMNRYSRQQMVLLGDAATAPLRISGRFRTGDSAGFASAVALLHGLSVQERKGRLELSKRS